MTIKLRLLLWYLNTFKKEDLINSPAHIRAQNAKDLALFLKVLDKAPIEIGDIKDQQILMRDGTRIPIRVYRPSKQTGLPLIVYYHGGGFVLRSIESHDRVCRRLARDNGAVVVSVDYRLAPEHKFPTPHQDCYDATVWIAEHATELGGNPDKITVMGDSAGGNLATVVSIIARDHNGPKIKNQVLIYPTVDARLCHASIETYSKGYFLTKAGMQWFIDHYKRSDKDIINPLMSPLLTEDLSNLPPAFVFTAALDPLKDEGAAYAKKLETAGNSIVFKEYPNVIHGFINMPNISKESLLAYDDIKEYLTYSSESTS